MANKNGFQVLGLVAIYAVAAKAAIAGCDPVRYRSVGPQLGSTPLSCNQWQTILTYTVPAGESGYVFARAQVNMMRTAASDDIYSWLVQVTVGPNPEIRPEMGSDLCYGVSALRRASGYGFVRPGDTVTLRAISTRTPCVNNQVAVESPSLHFWIEDPRPECQKRDIRVKSFFAHKAAHDINVVQRWTTTTQSLLQETMTIEDPEKSILVHADVTASIANNPTQQCGSEWASFVSLTTMAPTAGSSVVLDNKNGLMPASQGWGHIHFSSDLWNARKPGLGTWLFSIDVGAINIDSQCNDPNAPRHKCSTTTGGFDGDAVLGLIRF